MKPELAMPDNMDGAWKNYYYSCCCYNEEKSTYLLGQKWVSYFMAKI